MSNNTHATPKETTTTRSSSTSDQPLAQVVGIEHPQLGRNRKRSHLNLNGSNQDNTKRRKIAAHHGTQQAQPQQQQPQQPQTQRRTSSSTSASTTTTTHAHVQPIYSQTLQATSYSQASSAVVSTQPIQSAQSAQQMTFMQCMQDVNRYMYDIGQRMRFIARERDYGISVNQHMSQCVTDLTNKCHLLTKKYDALKTSTHKLQQAVQEKDKMMTLLTGKLSSASQQNVNLEHANQELSAKLEFSARHSKAEQQIENTQIESVQSEIEMLKASNEKLRELVDASENKNTELRCQYEERLRHKLATAKAVLLNHMQGVELDQHAEGPSVTSVKVDEKTSSTEWSISMSSHSHTDDTKLKYEAETSVDDERIKQETKMNRQLARMRQEKIALQNELYDTKREMIDLSRCVDFYQQDLNYEVKEVHEEEDEKLYLVQFAEAWVKEKYLKPNADE